MKLLIIATVLIALVCAAAAVPRAPQWPTSYSVEWMIENMDGTRYRGFSIYDYVTRKFRVDVQDRKDKLEVMMIQRDDLMYNYTVAGNDKNLWCSYERHTQQMKYPNLEGLPYIESVFLGMSPSNVFAWGNTNKSFAVGVNAYNDLITAMVDKDSGKEGWVFFFNWNMGVMDQGLFDVPTEFNCKPKTAEKNLAQTKGVEAPKTHVAAKVMDIMRKFGDHLATRN